MNWFSGVAGLYTVLGVIVLGVGVTILWIRRRRTPRFLVWQVAVLKQRDLETHQLDAVRHVQTVAPTATGPRRCIESAAQHNAAERIEDGQPVSDPMADARAVSSIVQKKWSSSEIEEAVVELAYRQPRYGELRVSDELRKRGIPISPEGVRRVWLKHDLDHQNKRLRAARAKAAHAASPSTKPHRGDARPSD
jgi:hypothetical protein